MCFRTLDLYTSAVLESTLNPVVQPKKEFRDAMEGMAKVLPGPVFMCRTQQSAREKHTGVAAPTTSLHPGKRWAKAGHTCPAANF